MYLIVHRIQIYKEQKRIYSNYTRLLNSCFYSFCHSTYSTKHTLLTMYTQKFECLILLPVFQMIHILLIYTKWHISKLCSLKLTSYIINVTGEVFYFSKSKLINLPLVICTSLAALLLITTSTREEIRNVVIT